MKALLLAFLLTIAATPFMDAWAASCSEWKTSSPNSTIMNYIRGLWGKPKDSAQAQSGNATPPDGLYFTKSSGFSARLQCEGEKKLAKTYLSYPIGLVVRKISEDKLSNKTYALVEAEHGLRMYILPNALEPLERDKTYIFADSARSKGYCFTQAGSTPAKCSLEDEKNAQEKKRILSPTETYAVAEGKWDECREDGDQPIAKARLYYRDHKPARQADGTTDQFVSVRYCLEPVKNSESGQLLAQPDHKVKIVRYDRYAKVFDESPRGTYHRFSKSSIQKLLPGYTNTKACDETVKVEKSDTEKGGVKGAVSIYVLEITGGAERSKIQSIISTKEKGYYQFYSTYSVEQADKNERTFPIEVIFTCKDTLVPQDMQLINVIYDKLEGDEFAIEISKLKEIFEKNALDEKDKYYGWSQASLDGRKLGQYWKIKGADQYFLLRDAFISYISSQTKVSELVEENVHASRYIQYFTHVVLSATTEFPNEQ